MIRRVCFGLIALLALVCAASAQTLTFPQLTGRVVDEAGIIDANARDDVGRKLAEFEQRTGAQIVVATVPSLQGTERRVRLPCDLSSAGGCGEAAEELYPLGYLQRPAQEQHACRKRYR